MTNKGAAGLGKGAAKGALVGTVNGDLLYNDLTGEWRARVSFDPPVREPILGRVCKTRDEAALCLLAMGRSFASIAEAVGCVAQLEVMTRELN